MWHLRLCCQKIPTENRFLPNRALQASKIRLLPKLHNISDKPIIAVPTLTEAQQMSSHVMCVTSGGGLPIYTRHKGNTENLPFSMVGALNGIHMFGKTQGMELLSTLAEDYVVAWKEFHDSLVFVGISTGCTVAVLDEVLRCCSDAMVMIVGLDEIRSQRNVERLKRELRICYPIVDRLMESLDSSDVQNNHSSDLVDIVEVILTGENHLIQIVLESYTECVDSIYSCVLIGGKIAVATESWWSLHPVELKLLSLLSTIENTSSSKDIPVFLPYRSPNAAFRFVACTLIPDVQVCCLCGPTPILEDIEHSASQCFRSSFEILERAQACSARSFPATVSIDQGILGLLLIDTKQGKYMISKNPKTNARRTTSNSHRLDTIRTFYYQAVKGALDARPDEKSSDVNVPRLTETYWCSEFHKCHALRVHDNVLCALYDSATPAQVMHAVTKNTLKALVGDKQFCW